MRVVLAALIISASVTAAAHPSSVTKLGLADLELDTGACQTKVADGLVGLTYGGSNPTLLLRITNKTFYEKGEIPPVGTRLFVRTQGHLPHPGMVVQLSRDHVVVETDEDLLGELYIGRSERVSFASRASDEYGIGASLKGLSRQAMNRMLDCNESQMGAE